MESSLELFFIIILFGYVYNHAVLTNPLPWNPQPSKTAPCGGGVQSTSPVANWKIGATITLVWQVIAGDGVGPVTLQFDTSGKTTNFSVNAPLTGPTPTTTGTFIFTFSAPNIACTGTGSTCTLNIFSSSNWFSCATVQFSTNGGAVTGPLTCIVPLTLSFCSMVNNKQVFIQGSTTTANINANDQQVALTYNQTLFNPNVFSNPTNPLCQQIYQKFFCGLTWPLCNKAAPGCITDCNAVVQQCGLLSTHFGLYNCSTFTELIGDASGPCSSSNLLKFNVFVIVIISFLLYYL